MLSLFSPLVLFRQLVREKKEQWFGLVKTRLPLSMNFG